MVLLFDLSDDPQAEMKVIRMKTNEFTSLLKKAM